MGCNCEFAPSRAGHERLAAVVARVSAWQDTGKVCELMMEIFIINKSSCI
jgi:hypothetical protein